MPCPRALTFGQGRGLRGRLLRDTTDFAAVLDKVKTAKPDVLVVASIRLDDLVAVARQMKELDFVTAG